MLESYLMSASGDPGGGGDALVVAAGHAAVIDGVTSKTRLTFDGLKGDVFAARTLSAAIRTLPADVTSEEAVEALRASLARAVADLGFDSELVHAPSARVALVSHERGELWQVGDVHALIDGQLCEGEAPPTDAVLSGVRAIFLEAALRSGARLEDLLAEDQSVHVLRPLREAQRLFANDPSSAWGFMAIDVQAPLAPRVKVTDISDAAEVVLASNGFAAVLPTLEETLAEHERLLTEDPLCAFSNRQLRRRSSAGWDDMAYLRLRRS